MKAKDTVIPWEEMAEILETVYPIREEFALRDTQAEVSFKAGIREVVDWCEKNFEPTVPMTLEYRKWHAKVKEWYEET